MSLHTVSVALAKRGVSHTVVSSVIDEDSSIVLQAAIASGRITTFDGLVEELGTADDVRYAKGYRTWVKKGRKGNPPKSKGNIRTAKFIRSVLHTIGVN